MIAIQAIDYNIMEKAIVYHFNVLFDDQNWVISKQYGDFVDLHEELASMYSPDQLPYLTGEVRPWARLSPDTGAKKLPKLENYLIEAVTTNFEPQLFTVTIPSSSDPSRMLRINKVLFDFLEFATFYRPNEPQGVAALKTNVTSADDDELGAVVIDMEVGGYKAAAAAVQEPAASTPPPPIDKEAAQKRERELEKMRLEAKAKESNRRIATSNSTVTTVTSQVRCAFENFSIIERDRIDYEIRVTLWGHVWVVEKRYSEFEALHQGMLEVYGTEEENGRGKGVPDFEDSKVPFFRKLEVGTAKSRQRFFRTYFHDLLRIIDTLEPQGLVAGFDIIINDDANKATPTTGDRRVKVAVNKFIFDFLNFQENLDRMTRTTASTAANMETIGQISKEVQEAIVDKQQAEKRLKVIKALEKRKRTRKVVSNQAIEELADYVPTIQDDVDVLNAIRYFVQQGTVLRDVQHLAKLYANVNGSSSLVSTLLNQDSSSASSPLEVLLPGDELVGTVVTFRTSQRGGVLSPQSKSKRDHGVFGTTSATGDVGFYDDGNDEFDLIDIDAGGVARTSNERVSEKPVSKMEVSKSRVSPATHKETLPGATTIVPLPTDASVGITSLQATTVAERIYFNDTRRGAITLFADALCDDDDWDKMFGTLIYHWAECRTDVESAIAGIPL